MAPSSGFIRVIRCGAGGGYPNPALRLIVLQKEALMQKWKIAASVLALTAAGFAAAPASAAPACDADNGGLKLPQGFCAMAVADGLGYARHAVAAANGDLYVALRASGGKPGGLVALRDSKGDGHFDVMQKFGDGLADNGSATGIALHEGHLYVAQPTQVVRYKMTPGQLVPQGQPEIVVSGFDSAREHADKAIAFDDKGNFYVNVGSPSNACQVRDRLKGSPGQDPCPLLEKHGGIWKFSAARLNQKQEDGSRIVTGLRQEPDVAWAHGAIYTVMNNRDQIDVLYPEHFSAEDNNDGPAEVMYRADPGADFGWPYCYFDYRQQKLLLNPEYGGDGKEAARCAKFTLPTASYPAHWAPVDVKFYGGSQFPSRYRGGAFIVFHGSWNRAGEQRPGAVVFQPIGGDGKASGKFEIFADNFAGTAPIRTQNDYPARPDGVAVAPDGSLFITDSQKGKVWRVFYRG
jgi:glucose/arabinose dehydrogenase